MSINMSNVKAITIGGQNVKKIEDKNGNVLWKVPSSDITTGTINITIGSGQDITTTQYYNRIVVPSLTTIKNVVANKASISLSNIVSIDTVEIILGVEPYPKAVKHSTSSARGTKIRFFLVLGSQITSTVLARGYYAYTVDFTSGNYANEPIARAFCTTSSGTDYIDITSYLSETIATYIYGAYVMGTTGYDSQTPSQMFGNSSNSGVHMCASSKSTLPTYSIRVSYSYRK